ncbi:MAG: hypothetical protein KAT74_04555, partial [Candidatus Cloacimonetes bacterium]|nr:hypothetical protein [Candidatus Cloacimonadota bacterium]
NGPPSPSILNPTQGVDSFIENYFDTDQFDYAEISTSYQNTDITRCISFIDNSYFVVTDFLSASSNHDYDWLLHGNGGGNTGNAYNMITNGSFYTVNDVDLYLFLNSTESVTFSSYNDYHEESYATAGEHTVTRGSVYGQNVIYSAFLIPLNERDSLEYFPINTGNANGGYIVHNNKKTLNLVKENYSLVSINFCEDEISFDSKSLIMVQNELENPEVVFLKDGQTLIYNDTPLIQCSEITNFNLNISDTSAKGFINNGCEVQLYTGNEPTQVTGADSYSFSNGILTLLFSDNTNFTIDVIWQLELLTPVNLTISISGNEIMLSWEHSVGATGYKIYSSEDPQLNMEDWILEDTIQDVNNWTTTITNNKKFFYVKAVRVWL